MSMVRGTETPTGSSGDGTTGDGSSSPPSTPSPLTDRDDTGRTGGRGRWQVIGTATASSRAGRTFARNRRRYACPTTQSLF